MRTLIIALFLTAYLPLAKAYPAVPRAEIFHVPWSVFTAFALTPDDVRRRAVLFIRIADETRVAAFAATLPQLADTKTHTPASGDMRLVIDFYDEKGRRTTFLADHHKLSAADGRKSVAIDENFRRTFFQFLAPKEI